MGCTLAAPLSFTPAQVAALQRPPGTPPRSAAPQQTSATLKLVIAATTDTHGRVRGWDYYTNSPDAVRGLTRVATIVDSLRAANPNEVVLVDAGDWLQGNPFTSAAAELLPKVHPVIAAMNALKYDAAVIGNHEFNYGVPFLVAAIAQARFPMLAANVVGADGKSKFGNTTFFTRNGIKIAIVGATTPGSMIWDRDNLRAAHLTVTDIMPAVRTAVSSARNAGAEVIIVVLHSGLGGASNYDGASTQTAEENVAARIPREVRGVDLVVFGHTHSELVDSTINGTLLIQPRNWATSVGVATLTVRRQNGKWAVIMRKGQSIPAAGHAESPAMLAATAEAHNTALKWANATVGKTTVAWRSDSARVQDSPITDFVAEVMRRETKADLAATTAFSIETRIDPGAITMAQLSQLYPYDNQLVAVRINGAQLRAFLEHSAKQFRTLNADGTAPTGGIVDNGVAGYNYEILSGADYVIDLRKPVGERVTSLLFRGQPVRDADSFTLALNSYHQNGAGGYAMLANLPRTYEKGTDIRGLLISELQRVGTLDPAEYARRNWRIEPASAVALAYAQQNRTRAAPQSNNIASTVTNAGAGAPPSANDVRPQQARRTLRVITTSDFHASLEARPDSRGRMVGGAVALQAALTQAREECKDTCTSVTVDGGDLFSGSPASDWASGKPTVAAYNRMGISAGALGNHELDFGQDTLRMRLSELKYRVLAANVVGTDGKVPAWLRSDTIVVRDGLRIGIIGAASQFTPASSRQRNVRGLKFLDPAPIVSARIKEMRAQHLDAVIVTIHDGARCTNGVSEGCDGTGIDFVKALTEKPDAVVLAHAHTNMLLTINGIPLVQVTSNARAIGVMDVALNSGVPATPTFRSVAADSLKNIDIVLDTIVRNAVNRVRTRLEAPVATIKETLTRPGEQYPLGNLVADATRVIGNADFGAANNGGIRADVHEGPLNFGGVHEIAPFGNAIARLSIRGRDLTPLLESFVRGKAPNSHVSGMEIVYDPSKAPGQRIVSITLPNGKPLNPAKVYTLALNDFMIDDPTFMKPEFVLSTQILPIEISAAIAEYLKRLPQPVVAPKELRIRMLGESR